MRHAACTPEFALFAVSAFVSFLLVSLAAFLLYGLLARLATQAATRCALAVAYIAGTAALWVRTLGALCLAVAVPPFPAGVRAPSPDALTVLLPAASLPLLTCLVPVGLALYAVLLFALVSVGSLRRWQLARALAFRRPPPALTASAFLRLAGEAGIPRTQLWLLPGLQSPAAIGFFRPAVYLPAEFPEANTTLPGILRHELAHIRRRDQLWEALGRLGRALVFFHPGVHRAFRDLRLQRELACDLQVVRTSPSERGRYADTLVRFGWMTTKARTEARMPDSFGVRFAARRSILGTRVRSILEGEPVYSRACRRQRLLFAAAGFWLFAALAPTLSINVGIGPVHAYLPAAPLVAPAPGLAAHRRVSVRAETSRRRAVSARLPAEEAFSVAISAPTLPHLFADPLPYVRYQSARETPPPDRRSSAREEDAEPEAPSSSTQPGSASPSRGLKLPSRTTSVLIGAAVALGRFGLGHIHDHDKD